MSKSDKEHAHEPAKVEKKLAPSEPMPPTGCVICGSYAGAFVDVTTHARAHEACAVARPDLIARVKARA